MAGGISDDSLVLVQPHTATMEEKSDGNGKPTRVELEQEVRMLQKMLENEKKVHQVLEQTIISGTTRPPLQIPSFLPEKVKELLAELVMVEEEIVRLEEEIKQNNQGIHDTQEARGHLTQESTKTIYGALSKLSRNTTSLTEDKAFQDKLVMETRPLFFINQAIQGDYTIDSFAHKRLAGCTTARKTVKKTPRVTERQKGIPRKDGVFRKPIKNGVVEMPVLPKLPSEQQMYKQTQAISEIQSNYSRKSTSVDSPLMRKHKKWQPNNLSEEIMKCLICIFLRVARSSRVMELEKSGYMLRMRNISPRPGSSRPEKIINLNGSFVTQRETSQQDPYGIFEIEGSIMRDIGPYKNLVKLTSSYLDIKRISSSFVLLSKLRVLLKELHDVDMCDLTHHQKLAFWINVYNSCIMNGFLEHGFPLNPEEVILLRDKAEINVGGNILNAAEIKKFILRQPSNVAKQEKENVAQSIYGLGHSDPNLVFALCCGNTSSPSLKVYNADNISTELEKSKVEYLQASIVVIAHKKLIIPELLLLNIQNFAEDLSSLLDWICQQLPTSGSLRKSVTQCLRGRNNQTINDIIDILPYKNELQYLLPM